MTPPTRPAVAEVAADVAAALEALGDLTGRAFDVVDTIGAGDTFMSSLVSSVLAHGSAGLGLSDLRRIGASAVRAAAITVSRAGADLPWRSEL